MTASDTMTVYPLTGNNEIVTKYELKLALAIGCEVTIHRGYVVPYAYKIKDNNVEFKENLITQFIRNGLRKDLNIKKEQV